MNSIIDLQKWIETGNEIEFIIGNNEYSITYSYAGNEQTIYLCKFNSTPVTFNSIDELLKSTHIENTEFSVLWQNARDVFVY